MSPDYTKKLSSLQIWKLSYTRGELERQGNTILYEARILPQIFGDISPIHLYYADSNGRLVSFAMQADMEPLGKKIIDRKPELVIQRDNYTFPMVRTAIATSLTYNLTESIILASLAFGLCIFYDIGMELRNGIIMKSMYDNDMTAWREYEKFLNHDHTSDIE